MVQKHGGPSFITSKSSHPCQGKKLTHISKEEAPASFLYRNKKKPFLFALFHLVLLQNS
jgi:hypothetical protein